MTLTYEKKDLTIILDNVESAIEDLIDWNDHNDELYAEEISRIYGALAIIDEKAKGLSK